MEPQVMIAVLALIISIVTFCYTTMNQKAQDNRWEELNAGKVDYVESKVIMWGEFKQEEVLAKEWGHKPVLYSVIENELHTNKYRIPYGLILYDSSMRTVIPDTGFGYTKQELENKIEIYHLDAESVEIRKDFQCKFVFLNSGNTPSENVRIKILCGTEPENYQVVLHETSDPIKMFPGKKVMVQTNFFIPLEELIPSRFYYRIEVTYDNFLKRGLSGFT
jgi:hypothetical protein